jgi:hypothetical protein
LSGACSVSCQGRCVQDLWEQGCFCKFLTTWCVLIANHFRRTNPFNDSPRIWRVPKWASPSKKKHNNFSRRKENFHFTVWSEINGKK